MDVSDNKTSCVKIIVHVYSAIVKSPTLSKAFPLLHGTKEGTPFSLFMKLENA